MPVRSIEEYQVGWVCALPKELTAARTMLDEEHDGLPTRVPQDGNTYVLGRVHNLNVVIACLPAGVYGTNSAAVVATNMMRTFMNIRICLMVGIGGGIPDLDRGVDIRLGDVVVSQPEQTHGGVVQYDLRKNLGAGVFERKGNLNQPPSVILGAISRLQSNHQMNKNQILENILKMQQRFPRLVEGGFVHPGPAHDILYCSKPGDHDGAELGTQCDHGIVRRKARTDQRPEIHYGTVASGNELMKNALERDRLGRELGAKCVEMEAAGLINDFPCIVIRGICDYADHQKNDVWQEYAAMTASAYARELLLLIPPAETRGTKTVEYATSRIPQRFPFPRNDDIVIRKPIFSTLEDLLPPSSSLQSAVLWGLGGAGKTQVALEFAYRRHLEQHYKVFWVHAGSYDKFLQGYRQIATDAGISSTLQGSELLTAVRSWLESQEEWLLVLDNTDDLTLFGLHHPLTTMDGCTNLLPFVPCGSYGSILWTTRDERAVGHLVGMSRGINVKDMTDDEAKELLTRLSGEVETSDNITFVLGILKHLERLPLAISQAAAFIRARHITYRDYLSRLGQEHKRWRMLIEDGPKRHRPDGVPHNVMQTWRITVDHLESAHPLSYWILRVIVYFHNQNIPWSLIKAVGLRKLRDVQEQRQSTDHKSVRAQTSDDDDSDLEDDEVRSALSRLTQFSLVRPRVDRNQESQSYDIHKLVQDATRRAVWQESKKSVRSTTYTAAETALQILSQEFPSGKYGTWDECAKLLTHALTIRNWPDMANLKFEMCDLLRDTSVYLWEQGRWDEAEELNIEVLQNRKVVLGEKHHDTIMSMADLAATYFQRGRLSDTEKLYTKVLELRKEVLGEKHPSTLRAMAELSSTYYKQNRLSEAEEIDIQVLELHKEVLGENHPETVRSMANLAATYTVQKRLDKAEEMNNKVVELQKAALGNKHPRTIKAMANLAVTYYQQRRFNEAEEIYRQVLELQMEVLSEKHPDSILIMFHLAVTCAEQGRKSEVQELFQQALQLAREMLGEDHPYTIKMVAYQRYSCGDD